MSSIACKSLLCGLVALLGIQALWVVIDAGSKLFAAPGCELGLSLSCSSPENSWQEKICKQTSCSTCLVFTNGTCVAPRMQGGDEMGRLVFAVVRLLMILMSLGIYLINRIWVMPWTEKVALV